MLINVVFNHCIGFVDTVDLFKSEFLRPTVLQRLKKPFNPSLGLRTVRPYRIDAKKGTDPLILGRVRFAVIVLDHRIKDAVPVAVKSHRNAVLEQVMLNTVQVRLCVLALAEISIGDHTRGVVNESDQTARRTLLTEPAMGTAVDLNQLSEALSSSTQAVCYTTL